MAAPKEPDCLKFISPVLKTGKEFAKRDPVVTYYCNVYSIQKSLSVLGKKRPREADMFLMSMMDQVEQAKKQLVGEEAVTSEVVAQAHLESKALQLFTYADNEDRAGRFGKNVVKAFYTSHILFEVLGQFGELSVEVMEKQKYAKWKAAYISRCLKEGQTPIAGPVGGEDEEAEASGGTAAAPAAAAAAGPPPSYPGYQQPPAPGPDVPAVGFGGLDMGSMPSNDPSDAGSIPGFVQPMNPLSTFVPPTNPPTSFDQTSPYSQPRSTGFAPPAASQSPASSVRDVPTFDPAAANTAAMGAPQPHAPPPAAPLPHAPPSPAARSLTPTASPAGSLKPTPAPRHYDPGKPIPVPASGDFRTLEYDQKARLEKLMKFAGSALMYDDMLTVAQNLCRATNLVFHGREE